TLSSSDPSPDPSPISGVPWTETLTFDFARLDSVLTCVTRVSFRIRGAVWTGCWATWDPGALGCWTCVCDKGCGWDGCCWVWVCGCGWTAVVLGVCSGVVSSSDSTTQRVATPDDCRMSSRMPSASSIGQFGAQPGPTSQLRQLPLSSVAAGCASGVAATPAVGTLPTDAQPNSPSSARAPAWSSIGVAGWFQDAAGPAVSTWTSRSTSRSTSSLKASTTSEVDCG